MKFHSIRRWLVLMIVVLVGIAISGLGFWLWDANNYPLPASLTLRTTSGGTPVTGFRREILQRRDQLVSWRAERRYRSNLRNLDLGKRIWHYQIRRPDGPGTIRGTLEFRAGKKAVFHPVIPPYTDSLPGDVRYSRPRFDVVRLSWDRKRLDLEITNWRGRSQNGRPLLQGTWEGRTLYLWQ